MISAGVFIVPMQQDLGWSRSAVTIAPMATFLMALASPAAGLLTDRFGSRVMATFALLGMGACYIALAFAPPMKVAIYFLAALLAIVGSAAATTVFSRAVATWFSHNVGLAFGLMASGIPIMGAIAAPWLSWIIENHGWRAGFLGLAALALLVGLPIVAYGLRESQQPDVRSPEDLQSRRARLGELIMRREFLLLLSTFLLVSIPIGGIQYHLFPLLRDTGFSAAAAASIISIFGIAVAVGRVAGGALLDRFNPTRIAALYFVLPAVGALLLAHGGRIELSWAMASASVFLIGIAQGAESDFIGFFTRKLFGVESFASVMSILCAFVVGGLSIGGILFSALYDATASYGLALLIAIGFYMVSSSMILRLR